MGSEDGTMELPVSVEDTGRSKGALRLVGELALEKRHGPEFLSDFTEQIGEGAGM